MTLDMNHIESRLLKAKLEEACDVSEETVEQMQEVMEECIDRGLMVMYKTIEGDSHDRKHLGHIMTGLGYDFPLNEKTLTHIDFDINLHKKSKIRLLEDEVQALSETFGIMSREEVVNHIYPKLKGTDEEHNSKIQKAIESSVSDKLDMETSFSPLGRIPTAGQVEVDGVGYTLMVEKMLSGTRLETKVKSRYGPVIGQPFTVRWGEEESDGPNPRVVIMGEKVGNYLPKDTYYFDIETAYRDSHPGSVLEIETYPWEKKETDPPKENKGGESKTKMLERLLEWLNS